MFCVALFADDQLHYRAKVDKVEGDFVNVTFVDYGNVSCFISVRRCVFYCLRQFSCTTRMRMRFMCTRVYP